METVRVTGGRITTSVDTFVDCLYAYNHFHIENIPLSWLPNKGDANMLWCPELYVKQHDGVVSTEE